MADKDIPSFGEFIQAEREKKKKEQLANEIFGRGRKPATRGRGGAAITSRKGPGPAPTLASRMGVTKRSASSRPNINGKWGHDLHALNNPRARPFQAPRAVSASQLDRNNRLFGGLRSTIQDTSQGDSNGALSGFNIKGAGGGTQCTVIASNFAPGTTAADIEAVMAPIGGELLRCKLISSQPTVMAEMLFADAEGAENVIATFNGKKADGRVLYVYLKDTRNQIAKPSPRPIPRGPRAYEEMDLDVQDNQGAARYNGRRAEPSFQDGRYGFSERQANTWRREPPAPSESQGGQGGLVSDSIIRRERY
jgi:hypothetical protein